MHMRLSDDSASIPVPPQGADPLRNIYRSSQVKNPAHFEYLYRRGTALLCIDLQYLDAARGEGIFRDVEKAGIPLEWQDYYFERLEQTVIPNVRRLQEGFRRHELEVLHTRIQSLTADGRDRSQGHKRLKILAPPGSREAEFLEEIAPVGDEIVMNKTTSGVFSSTNFHYVLSNIGVRALYVSGVYTNECVETTVRDACDLGYLVTIVQDACATVTAELQEASLKTLRNRYARIVTTDEALDDLERFVAETSEWVPAY